MQTTTATVMVVEDNGGNRALAKATLEDEGYEVVIATSGDEGIALAAALMPDCILMDIRMPGVDGIAACEQIRALPGGHDVAIVFVTAVRDVATFDRALAAGGDDFITKPYRPDELLVRVQTALRLRRIASERSDLARQLKQQRERLQRLELQREQLVAFFVSNLEAPDESRAMLRLVTDLLDLSAADEGRLLPTTHAIDTVELVRRVVEDLEDRARSANVTLEVDITAPELRADPDLLSRVLANLIDNALRQAPVGSDIRVSVAPGHEGIELRVSDAGPGIPADERARVFERYRHAPPTNRGAGLAFCKAAVEAQGGQIWIEDAAPGTVFCIRLAKPGDE